MCDRMRGRAAVWTLAFVLCAPLPALAAEAGDPPPPVRELRFHLWLDAAVVAANTAALVAVATVGDGPTRCRWCERSDLNGVDRWFRDRFKSSNAQAAERIGGVSLALLPLGLVGLAVATSHHDGVSARTLGVDALILAEAVSTALLLTAISKRVTARQRPYALDLPADEIAREPRPRDENAAFFSGHTALALAFSLATSAGTVAWLRGYRLAPLVWAMGLTLATVSGALRLAGDEHYFTDLLAGAAVGSASGFLVPYLFHAPRTVSISPFHDHGVSGLAARWPW
jgi:membrane-associated phospholipid phosphatase